MNERTNDATGNNHLSFHRFTTGRPLRPLSGRTVDGLYRANWSTILPTAADPKPDPLNRFCRSTGDFFVGPGWSRFRSVSQTNQAKNSISHLLHAKESLVNTRAQPTHVAQCIFWEFPIEQSTLCLFSTLLSGLFFSPLVRHYFHMVPSIIRENPIP